MKNQNNGYMGRIYKHICRHKMQHFYSKLPWRVELRKGWELKIDFINVCDNLIRKH